MPQTSRPPHTHLDVQVHQLLPVLLLLAYAYEARDVDALAKQLEVLHQLVRLELGVQDAQLSEDAHVRTLQALRGEGRGGRGDNSSSSSSECVSESAHVRTPQALSGGRRGGGSSECVSG